MTYYHGCGVGGKISDSDSNSDLSKISDSDFSKFPTPDSGLSKISDSRHLNIKDWNLAVKINGNRVAQHETSVSTKVSKEIVQFQQELPNLRVGCENDPSGLPESRLDKNI